MRHVTSKSVVYNKMNRYGINNRLKENQVDCMGIFKNTQTGDRGWWFSTKGGHRGRVVLGGDFEYRGRNYSD